MYIEDDFYIIKKMQSIARYKENWEAIRTIFKGKLDSGAVSSKIKYTTHDYSHHCINIYTNIENIVLKRACSELTPTELFILNVAVILHDYVMAINPEKRFTHARDAAEYIMKSVNDTNGTELNHLLTNEEARLVAYVVMGHGDIKGNNVEVNTLKYVVDEYVNKYYASPIKIPYLAAILRLADEFDCTANRLICPLEEVGLTDSKEDINSRRHYRKLQLVERVGIKQSPSNILYLYCNDYVLNEKTYDEDAQNMIEVREKLLKEIINVKQNVYNYFEQEHCPIKIYDDIKIMSGNDKFLKKITEMNT